MLEKFNPEIDFCHGLWEQKGTPNQNMAIFNFDYHHHLTDAEKKAAKDKPEQITAPKMFDLSKAQRVFVDKDEIKRREQEAEREKLKDV